MTSLWSMSQVSVFAAVTVLLVALVDADCSGLWFEAANEENSSTLVITGTVTAGEWEDASLVMMLSKEPMSVESSEGIEDVSVNANQLQMTVSEITDGKFSVTLEKTDETEVTITYVSANDALCDITQLSLGTAEWTWEGRRGPVFWEELGYPDCGPSNEFQSPFNIESGLAESGNFSAVMDHDYADYAVSQSHGVPTYSCATAGTCGSITADGVQYDLLQFHFHSYSEYALDGAVGVLAVHFVHISEDNALLVLGRIFHMGDSANVGFGEFWTEEVFSAREGDGRIVNLNVKTEIYDGATAEGQVLYKFQGSLTTPPCTGNVNWLVFGSPGTISIEQAETYRRYAALTNQRGENRPLQPFNDRELVVMTF